MYTCKYLNVYDYRVDGLFGLTIMELLLKSHLRQFQIDVIERNPAKLTEGGTNDDERHEESSKNRLGRLTDTRPHNHPAQRVQRPTVAVTATGNR